MGASGESVSGKPPALRTGFADVNGARLFYEMAGEGSALVLLHASFCDLRMWDDQFDLFSRCCKVVRYDQRGCGTSSAVETAFSFSEDLLGLLDALEIDRACVLGLSLGAYVALDFAITHPKRTAGLIVAAAAPGGYKVSEALQQRWASIFAAGAHDPDLGIQLLLDDPQVGFERQSAAARERLMRMFLDNRRVFQRDPALVKVLQPQAIERLAEISAPTLVIAAEYDDPDLRAAGQLLESRIAGATRVTIQGAGHLSNIERPGEFNQVVLNFCGAFH